MVKDLSKEIDSHLTSDSSLTSYCHFVYKYFGRDLLKKKSFRKVFDKNIYNKRYETILRRANMRLLPEEYFVSIYLTIVFTLVFLLVFTILFLFINSVVSVLLFYGGILFLAGLGIFLYNYPILVANKRGEEIDAAIPYLLPYLKILSKELSIAKMINIIDDFLIYNELRSEFKKIKYYSDFLGYDIHSSIREAMVSCPSKQLSDMMNDMVTISNSGGNVYNYLDKKLNNLNEEIEALEKKSLDTLLIFSQIYVVLLLIAPLFFTIMSSILNLVEFSADGGSGGGGSIVGVILMMLMILPFAYAGFMMLVYYSKPLYARLKPNE